MRQLRESAIDGGSQWRVASESGDALAFGDVLQGWASSESFRRHWIDWLRALPLDAFVWECPPVSAANL